MAGFGDLSSPVPIFLFTVTNKTVVDLATDFRNIIVGTWGSDEASAIVKRKWRQSWQLVSKLPVTTALTEEGVRSAEKLV